MIYLPLLLASKFKDFTPVDIVVYTLLAFLLIFFALYYRRRSEGVGISVVELREKYLAEHPGLSEVLVKAIKNGELVEGMNEEEITAAIGRPQRVQLLRTSPVRNEVWIYRSGIYAGLEDGILKNWRLKSKLIRIR